MIRVPGVVVAAVILWIVITAAALPKTPPLFPVARFSRLIVSWWSKKVAFYAVRFLLAGGGLS